MIVFGTHPVVVKFAEVNNTTCPVCNEEGTIEMILYREHLHFFWIPFVPVGKDITVKCLECDAIMAPRHFSPILKREYDHLKKEVRGPIWQYSGLAILVALIVTIALFIWQDNRKMQGYIASPEAGDLYTYEVEDGGYSTLKVIDVFGDSIFVQPNQFGVGSERDISDIDIPTNYEDIILGMSKATVQEMYDKGEITDVERD